MVQPIKEFIAAWQSLAGVDKSDGWRGIPVSKIGICELIAGRRFPSNMESMLAHFPSVNIPASDQFPEGNGFTVERVDKYGDGRTWLALTRKENGNVELFSVMVEDVLNSITSVKTTDSLYLMRIFLGRVRAWQEFMRKGAQPLRPEAEIGLIGELYFVRKFIDEGVPPNVVLDSWVGPLDKTQDFELGTGAVEIKTTVSAKGFLAKIGSLEQLDDSIRQPLFLAGLRLVQTVSGQALPDFVNAVSNAISGDPEAERIFSDKLLVAGYVSKHSDRYIRKFITSEILAFEVSEGFPRITHGTIPYGIKRAIYEIDLEQISGDRFELSQVLNKLGVL